MSEGKCPPEQPAWSENFSKIEDSNNNHTKSGRMRTLCPDGVTPTAGAPPAYTACPGPIAPFPTAPPQGTGGYTPGRPGFSLTRGTRTPPGSEGSITALFARRIFSFVSMAKSWPTAAPRLLTVAPRLLTSVLRLLTSVLRSLTVVIRGTAQAGAPAAGYACAAAASVLVWVLSEKIAKIIVLYADNRMEKNTIKFYSQFGKLPS